MLNQKLKDYVVSRVLPSVQGPMQYVGGEVNMVRKDHRDVRGRLCLAFPDTYSIGMSHHGLQVLYSLMNARADWVCERAFTPWLDMERELRRAAAPLYSLESFTPLFAFDVLGFSLQYELSYTNVLTMLDLGGIPLRSVDRTLAHPLVIAGGPCAQNPEPLAPFVDVFIVGDGEPSLGVICDLWLRLKQDAAALVPPCPALSRRDDHLHREAFAGRTQREELLAELAAQLPFAYVPRFYEPHFEQLIGRMRETFQPLGVKISLPSLRVNEQLKSVATLLSAYGDLSGLTLAPEVARDDMREQIRKKIKNEDLYEGCRQAFQHGWRQVKLYFLCGLPGERPVDLDGIVEMAETISHIGREATGRPAKVTASVSNFVPKSHTPYQWNGMQTREYFQWAHEQLHKRRRVKAVTIKCHDVETALLEGVLSRGDRRVADAIELAWRRGARLDSWRECIRPDRWWRALADCGIDIERTVHRTLTIGARLPWDHVNVRQGRTWLEKEQNRSIEQLAVM